MDVACACCEERVAAFVRLRCHREVAICYRCLDWLGHKRREQTAGHAGGWHVTGLEPIFMVSDVDQAVHHFQKLGFETSYHDETYAFAHRDGNLTIHLAHEEGERPIPSSLYIHVDDADQVATEWRLAGLEVVGPEDFDYGKREGRHTDPDGNLIRFGAPLRESDLH